MTFRQNDHVAPPTPGPTDSEIARASRIEFLCYDGQVCTAIPVSAKFMNGNATQIAVRDVQPPSGPRSDVVDMEEVVDRAAVIGVIA